MVLLVVGPSLVLLRSSETTTRKIASIIYTFDTSEVYVYHDWVSDSSERAPY